MVECPILLLATGNAGKRREVQAILADLPVKLLTLADVAPIEAVEETGKTFAENAAIKALYYANHTGYWTLADDSGLEVDALDGRPGVYSARFAGPDASDEANNAKLICALADVPDSKRTARFHCAIALASDGQVTATASGAIEGTIVDSPLGNNGFGYDPHFMIPARNLTAAQLDAAEKNSISHRAKALAAIKPLINRILSGDDPISKSC